MAIQEQAQWSFSSMEKSPKDEACSIKNPLCYKCLRGTVVAYFFLHKRLRFEHSFLQKISTNSVNYLTIIINEKLI